MNVFLFVVLQPEIANRYAVSTFELYCVSISPFGVLYVDTTSQFASWQWSRTLWAHWSYRHICAYELEIPCSWLCACLTGCCSGPTWGKWEGTSQFPTQCEHNSHQLSNCLISRIEIQFTWASCTFLECMRRTPCKSGSLPQKSLWLSIWRTLRAFQVPSMIWQSHQLPHQISQGTR